jgi:GNAT superfamily N-acetyltransferase
MRIVNLAEEHFPEVIRLGNKINGENYLDGRRIKEASLKGCSQGLSCNYVAYDKDTFVGFRLAYAPGKWEIDKWCTTRAWGVPPDKVCYLKANMVEEEYRRQGVGTALLNKSLETAKEMGAVAAVAHSWVDSPGGSAIKYFAKAGGHFIKLHHNRWLEDCITDNWRCIHHGDHCTCSTVEMIIYFGEQV